jgi:hypothetical protein
MVDSVANSLETGGLVGLSELHLARLPLGAIPSKVYSSLSALNDIPLYLFLLWTIPMRILRLSWAMLLATWLNGKYRDSIKRRANTWTVAYVAFWVTLHASYYLIVALTFHK